MPDLDEERESDDPRTSKSSTEPRLPPAVANTLAAAGFFLQASRTLDLAFEYDVVTFSQELMQNVCRQEKRDN